MIESAAKMQNTNTKEGLFNDLLMCLIFMVCNLEASERYCKTI